METELVLPPAPATRANPDKSGVCAEGNAIRRTVPFNAYGNTDPMRRRFTFTRPCDRVPVVLRQSQGVPSAGTSRVRVTGSAPTAPNASAPGTATACAVPLVNKITLPACAARLEMLSQRIEATGGANVPPARSVTLPMSFVAPVRAN